MKQAFIKPSIFLIGCLISTVAAFCVETKNHANTQHEKFYVSIEQIAIEDQGMFVNLEGNVVPINALYRDEKGFYLVELPDPKCTYCPRCQTTHSAAAPCPHKKDNSSSNTKKGKKQK